LRSMHFEDLPGACRTANSSGRFRKYRVKTACWETQDMYFKILTNASNF
jgi:hypothetical protein